MNLIHALISSCMIFSKTFETTGNTLNRSVVFRFLLESYFSYIVVTSTSFNSSGNSLLLKVLLKSFCRISEQHSLLSFRIFGGIFLKV